MIVTNGPANPVAVHEQGTADVNVTNTTLPVEEHVATQLVESGTVSSGNETLPDVDVSAYKEIRVTAGGDFVCVGTTPSQLDIFAEESGRFYLIDQIPFCAVGNPAPPGRVYDVPGRTLRIECACFPQDQIGVTVFGRSN